MDASPAGDQPEDPTAPVAALFDSLAESYDQSGVPFFTTIASGLCLELGPRPGERALDLGCGRGALTFPLADGVGPSGRVDACDISTAMVELTAAAAARRGDDHVSVAHGDARDPSYPSSSYDVIGSSMVLFFLPDPAAAVRRWVRLLAPGGRVGAATFEPWSPRWQQITDLLDSYAERPPGVPAPTSMPSLFAHDKGVERLFSSAGARGVRTSAVTYAIPFADIEQWHRWSLSTAMRGHWREAPAERHAEMLAGVAEILDETRDADGRLCLDVDIRYTIAHAPD
ncbi:class I SAM-dependent methyltransferase [Nocardioides pacificus]